MKVLITKAILVVCFLSINSFQTLQETKTFTGIYDGHEDYGYNFIGAHEDETEYTMTFHKLDRSIAFVYNFDSQDLIGKTFNLTYTSKTEKFKDVDGFDDEREVLTITKVAEQ